LRRALLTLGGTVAGIAALVAFKFQPAAGSAAAAAGLAAPGASLSTTGDAGTAAGTGRATGSMVPTTAPAAKPPATGRPSATPPAATAAPKPSSRAGAGQSTAARMITGAVANTQYGPMQVEITVSGKRITNVTVLQETNAGGPTSSIDAMAIPQLTQEALAAQSANINAVSGASYTSAGYKQSLQSAIDQAGL
jgi:uncharacterized protein with FMN-binding domain